MPTLFNTSPILREALRRDRRQGFAHAVRVRFRKWQRAIQRRKNQRALEECLRRLNQRTIDDIGLARLIEPPPDELAAETEIHAVRHRSPGTT